MVPCALVHIPPALDLHVRAVVVGQDRRPDEPVVTCAPGEELLAGADLDEAAGAKGELRLGISRALLEFNRELKPALKAAGLLTRDSRIKERKKYGLLGARKAPQYHKR